ncbi:MAG: hypothetical protein FJ088_07835, partial [Deltaproteobacteria bacterium]|nr:hypothetical protein [Deltaproteobacteria bacterium]
MPRVISYLLMAGLTLFAAAGCDGSGGGEGNLGSVSIALGSFTSEGVPLYLQNNKGFRLKIYKNSPQDRNEEPYYDTGCQPYGGDLFSVYGIPIGSNRAIMFEGYTSITEVKSGEWRCDNLAFFGLRGGG